MGTLVDSQRPWLWTQADLLWHSCLFPWLSALEPFTEGSGPGGFCSTPLAHGTLTDSCLSNGQAVVYQVLSPGLSVLCVSTQPPVFCKPASWPWIPPKAHPSSHSDIKGPVHQQWQHRKLDLGMKDKERSLLSHLTPEVNWKLIQTSC